MIVKVDHRDIVVVGVPVNRKHSGRYISAACMIEVVIQQSSRQQADTLIHELFHAIWDTRGCPSAMKEEEAVTRLSSGWTTIIRDNPHLCIALEQALRSGKPIFEEESKP